MPKYDKADIERRMTGAVESLKGDLAGLRTGRAIVHANLGLNPMIDGQTLRLPIPDLTEERRKELAKLAGQYAEKAKIAIRNVRRDGMDHLKQDEKKHEISEDERKRSETEVQKLTDEA